MDMATNDDNHQRRPKPVFWVASSRKDLKKFPKGVRQTVGQALFDAQTGGKHPAAKPPKGFHGAGVLEVVEDDDGNTYRAVYARGQDAGGRNREGENSIEGGREAPCGMVREAERGRPRAALK